MVSPIVVHKGRINGPIDSGDWSRCESRVERRDLVNQGKPIPGLDHPLDVGWSACRAGQMHWNPYLVKHLRKPRVGRWLEFRIAEYLDPISDVLDVELTLMYERIITPQADY
jgi:hypothetical protein